MTPYSGWVPNDGNVGDDVFVRDRVAGTTVRLSSHYQTGIAVGGLRPGISADGSTVAFTSSSSLLVPGDTNGIVDVFVAPAGGQFGRHFDLEDEFLVGRQRFDRAIDRVHHIAERVAGQIERELGITPGLLVKWRARYQIMAKDGLPPQIGPSDMEAAKAEIAAEMEALGATLGADGKWQYQGAPVVLGKLRLEEGDWGDIITQSCHGQKQRRQK